MLGDGSYVVSRFFRGQTNYITGRMVAVLNSCYCQMCYNHCNNCYNKEQSDKYRGSRISIFGYDDNVRKSNSWNGVLPLHGDSFLCQVISQKSDNIFFVKLIKKIELVSGKIFHDEMEELRPIWTNFGENYNIAYVGDIYDIVNFSEFLKDKISMRSVRDLLEDVTIDVSGLGVSHLTRATNILKNDNISIPKRLQQEAEWKKIILATISWLEVISSGYKKEFVFNILYEYYDNLKNIDRDVVVIDSQERSEKESSLPESFSTSVCEVVC